MKPLIKFFVSVLIAMTFLAKSSFGQVLLVNFTIGNCGSCYKGFYLLKTKTTQLPTYVVFPEEYLSDKEKIEELVNLEEFGIGLLFNDELYKLSKSPNSGDPYVSMISENKEVVFKQRLMDLVDSDSLYAKLILEVRDSLFANNYTVIPTSKYLGPYAFRFNYSLGRLDVYKDNTIIKKISKKDLTDDIWQKSLDEKSYNNRAYSQSKLTLGTGFVPKYRWSQIDDLGNVYILYAEDQLDTVNQIIDLIFYLVKYNSEFIPQKIHEIKVPKGYYFNSPLFYVHDNKFFINLRLDKVDSILKQNSDLYIDHIAIYKFNSKQELTFSGFQKLDLPSINKKVYGFSYISFENWNYPYVNYSNNNEIVDLLSDRKVKLFSDSLIFSLAEVNYGK